MRTMRFIPPREAVATESSFHPALGKSCRASRNPSPKSRAPGRYFSGDGPRRMMMLSGTIKKKTGLIVSRLPHRHNGVLSDRLPEGISRIQRAERPIHEYVNAG